MNRSLRVSALAAALVFAGCSAPDSDPAQTSAAASSSPEPAATSSPESVDFAAVAAEEAARTMEMSDFSADAGADWEHPVTPWGDPDLRGAGAGGQSLARQYSSAAE